MEESHFGVSLWSGRIFLFDFMVANLQRNLPKGAANPPKKIICVSVSGAFQCATVPFLLLSQE